MGIKVKSTGDFKNIENYILTHKESMFTEEQIVEIAEKSLELFKKNTPTKSGVTAESWSYEIKKVKGEYVIDMHNSNIHNGVNVAILVDSGHALYNGGWVPGTHYIDQTIEEIFKYVDKMK